MSKVDRLKELLARRYPLGVAMETHQDGTRTVTVWLTDLPGCIASGTTLDEAKARLETIKPALFKKLLGLGLDFPEASSAVTVASVKRYESHRRAIPKLQQKAPAEKVRTLTTHVPATA